MPTCGDGYFNASANEACDDGGQSANCDADCTLAVCGDGVLNTDAGEACDDGGTADGNGCSATCTLEIRRVFQTSLAYTVPQLGSVAGADALCQGLAQDAGLTGTFRAWLSDNNSSPATSWTNVSVGPYALVDDTVVANSWADLVDGVLLASIDLDEDGVLAGAGNDTCDFSSNVVWTNTTQTGALNSGTLDCGNWNDAGSAAGSAWGLGGRTDTGWTQACSGGNCGGSAHLYCFEQ